MKQVAEFIALPLIRWINVFVKEGAGFSSMPQAVKTIDPIYKMGPWGIQRATVQSLWYLSFPKGVGKMCV